jgi:hypothetical protein
MFEIFIAPEMEENRRLSEGLKLNLIHRFVFSLSDVNLAIPVTGLGGL